MKRSNLRRAALPLFILPLLFAPSLRSETARAYETGFPNVTKISTDLYRALEPKYRRDLSATPILLPEIEKPYLQPVMQSTASNTVKAVCISGGFITLMNSFSHAMAIDNADKGYLNKYLASLAAENSSGFTPQNAANDQAWSFDTMNYQISQFNQMVAALVAVDMAYHYLGYYDKYAAQLRSNSDTAITSLLSESEWRKAMMRGGRNALDCGFGIDGVKYFYENLGRMPQRPAWAAYFLPPDADIGKISKDLKRLEEYFFAGRKFLD